MWAPPHGIDMYQPTPGSSVDRRRGPPSLVASFGFMASAIGIVGVAYAVAAAPILVTAFVAGLATALVVTTAVRFQDRNETTETLSDPQPVRR